MCGSVHRLQQRFPIDGILFQSGDIRDQLRRCPKSRQNCDFLGSQFFAWGRGRVAVSIYYARSLHLSVQRDCLTK